MSAPTPTDLAWCRGQIALVRDLGVWAVPRSGLVFQRRGEGFVRVACLPWCPGMAGDPASWAAYQAADFAKIQEVFALAGVSLK